MPRKPKPLAWATETRVVSDLIPHPRNPRQLTEKQAADLTASLDKFNLAEIPVINTDNMILAGHQRLKILAILGRSEEAIEVRVPNRTLTIEECDEYLLRSNKNTGEWDFDILANQWEEELLKEVGFEDWEFGKWGEDDLEEKAENAGEHTDPITEKISIVCPKGHGDAIRAIIEEALSGHEVEIK